MFYASTIVGTADNIWQTDYNTGGTSNGMKVQRTAETNDVGLVDEKNKPNSFVLQEIVPGVYIKFHEISSPFTFVPRSVTVVPSYICIVLSVPSVATKHILPSPIGENTGYAGSVAVIGNT